MKVLSIRRTLSGLEAEPFAVQTVPQTDIVFPIFTNINKSKHVYYSIFCIFLFE